VLPVTNMISQLISFCSQPIRVLLLSSLIIDFK